MRRQAPGAAEPHKLRPKGKAGSIPGLRFQSYIRCMNSKAIGERTEGIVLAQLLRCGYSVLLPFGNNQRYDMVVDKGDGKFVRGQCKTARATSNGCVVFNTASINGFTGKRTSYIGQIDVFWVYAPLTDCVYEVPIGSVGGNAGRLRISSPNGGATSKIRWAKDFVLRNQSMVV